MAELMNLSDGRRSVAEIARVVNYEIGPVDPPLVAEMFCDMQELLAAGFVDHRSAGLCDDDSAS